MPTFLQNLGHHVLEKAYPWLIYYKTDITTDMSSVM